MLEYLKSDNLRFADKQTMQPIGLQTTEEDMRLMAIVFLMGLLHLSF